MKNLKNRNWIILLLFFLFLFSFLAVALVANKQSTENRSRAAYATPKPPEPTRGGGPKPTGGIGRGRINCLDWVSIQINECNYGQWKANQPKCTTDNRDVTLNMHPYQSSATEMRFTEPETFTTTCGSVDNEWTEWTPYYSTADWTLAEGDGDKKVCTQFKNAQGLVSPMCYGGIRLNEIK